MWEVHVKTLCYFPALALIFIVQTAFAADANNGERLAQRWCASCHVVAMNQREANADAPPFETIARTFGFNSEKLAFFLLEPHPKMPSMGLSRTEASDLAAYIGALAK
jgi:mono/diheme cytochrome c family protein